MILFPRHYLWSPKSRWPSASNAGLKQSYTSAVFQCVWSVSKNRTTSENPPQRNRPKPINQRFEIRINRPAFSLAPTLGVCFPLA